LNDTGTLTSCPAAFLNVNFALGRRGAADAEWYFRNSEEESNREWR
jgi:hypothetical protein